MTRSTSIIVGLAVALAAVGCRSVTRVEPDELPLTGYTEVKVRGTGFSELVEPQIEVRFGGVLAVDVHVIDDTTIRATPQGSATPGLVSVSVADTRLFGLVTTKPAAFEWLDTAFPGFRSVVAFGPSLTAGVSNSGYSPPGQIHSIPGFVARQLGIWFPQRIALEGGLPSIDSPHETDLVFVGDGVRECWLPATDERFIPAPGELCDPVVVSLAAVPLQKIITGLIDEILSGLLRGRGLMGGLFQDVKIENRNWSVPGEQMAGQTLGVKPPFSFLQNFFNHPTAPLRNPACAGEPPIKMIADMQDPADLVLGLDWFFDSVLFSNPPLDDLVHQMAFAMLVLSTSQYHQGELCPPGTNDGTWRVPLVSTDGTLTRTYQPYSGMPESCDPALRCPDDPTASDQDVVATARQAIREGGATTKAGYVIDWLTLGLAPITADRNGNGILDIHPNDPAANELTVDLLASILRSDDPSDDPRAVVLGTMPWPSTSPIGGSVGGATDRYAERVNRELEGLQALFDEAFVLSGRPGNLVLTDTAGGTRDILEGRRTDLTHGLDGDPATQDLFYSYQVDASGNPIQRRFTSYGGIFSLDHLHLSHTMNASSANEMIDAINSKLGESIPPIDLQEVWLEDPYNHLKYDPSIRCAYTGEACSTTR